MGRVNQIDTLEEETDRTKNVLHQHEFTIKDMILNEQKLSATLTNLETEKRKLQDNMQNKLDEHEFTIKDMILNKQKLSATLTNLEMEKRKLQDIMQNKLD